MEVARIIRNYRYLLSLDNRRIHRLSGYDKNNRLDFGKDFLKLNNVLLILLFKVPMKKNKHPKHLETFTRSRDEVHGLELVSAREGCTGHAGGYGERLLMAQAPE